MAQQIGIYDHTTGEQLTRDMTSKELAEYQKSLLPKVLTEAEQIAKDAKAAAQAKLEALGLTADDLKALGL
jgi:hypothetical protein